MAAKAKKRKTTKAKWLVFVDTNILLDFYRLGGDSAKRTLANLESHSGSLILTDQVWMEFLKNRQKVILQTIKDINKPSDQAMPAMLNDVQTTMSAAVLKQFLLAKKNSDQNEGGSGDLA